MAVPRERIVEATTEQIRAEFRHIINIVAKISIDQRYLRLAIFDELVKKLPKDASELFELSSLKERQHVQHVRKTLEQIPEQSKDRKLHDFTKDRLYFFTTSSKFDFDITGVAMEILFKSEVDRHYKYERHHEQHEEMNEVDFGDDDIREMAVDRMSRSIQTNQGRVNMDDMRKYTPKFVRGDNESKQQQFLGYVTQYTDLAERTYQEVLNAPREAPTAEDVESELSQLNVKDDDKLQ